MRYRAISVCKNNSKKRPDLNFFDFLSEKKLRKKWSTFCRRADKEFQSTANLRTCSQHFDTKDIVKTLCGIKEGSKRGVSNDIQPTRGSKWPKRTRKTNDFRRGKRDLTGESDLMFPAKSPRVSSDVALKDHDYIFLCKDNKVSSSPTEKKHKHGKKNSVSVSSWLGDLRFDQVVL